MKKNVYVTGIGIVTPLRPFQGAGDFWDALCSGESGIKMMKPPLLELDGEWPLAGIDLSGSPEHVEIQEKAGFIAGWALNEALSDAGLERPGRTKVNRTGIIVGTVLGNMLSREKVLIKGRNSADHNHCLPDIAADLAARHHIMGPVLTVSTACASGTDALGIAARKIINDKADVMIAGGVDVLSDLAIAGFHSLQAFTKEKVRPFDKNRSGLAIGEGAAFAVIESEEHAYARGARAHARVAGYAARSDANHLTGPHKEGRGLANALRAAVSEAGILPEDIDYINVHGTGTVYNDLMETKALKSAFGKAAYNIPLSSTKSMLGHSFGAAGVIEAICCLLSIKTKKIPPTINYRDQDPECDLDYVPNSVRAHDVTVAASQSAGFGGQNSVIIFDSP